MQSDQSEMKILLLLAGFGLALARPDGSRIVGGDTVDIAEVPYQLALETGPIIWTQACGASIIGLNLALTAGHCTGGFEVGQIRLRSGSTRVAGGTIHYAQDVIVHELFTFRPIDYDISIIIVQEPFEYGPNVQPVPLAIEEPQPGDVATVSGWGITWNGGLFPSNLLRKVEIPIVDKEVCKEEYVDSGDVTETMICAGEKGKDSCQGDSGGPLVVNGTQVGIVSWGVGCAMEGYPGVYTNVAYFAGWLEEQNVTLTFE